MLPVFFLEITIFPRYSMKITILAKHRLKFTISENAAWNSPYFQDAALSIEMTIFSKHSLEITILFLKIQLTRYSLDTEFTMISKHRYKITIFQNTARNLQYFQDAVSKLPFYSQDSFTIVLLLEFTIFSRSSI